MRRPASGRENPIFTPNPRCPTGRRTPSTLVPPLAGLAASGCGSVSTGRRSVLPWPRLAVGRHDQGTTSRHEHGTTPCRAQTRDRRPPPARCWRRCGVPGAARGGDERDPVTLVEGAWLQGRGEDRWRRSKDGQEVRGGGLRRRLQETAGGRRHGACRCRGSHPSRRPVGGRVHAVAPA